MWNVLSGDFGLGSFWLLFSILTQRTFTSLCFSQPDPLLAISQGSSNLLTHPETEKRKWKSVWPMENFTADKTIPNPSLLCSISNLEISSFGLSSVGFSQLWRCPDSQQSCWVTMPQSDFEICYCSLKSFFLGVCHISLPYLAFNSFLALIIFFSY